MFKINTPQNLVNVSESIYKYPQQFLFLMISIKPESKKYVQQQMK